jgi:hypothetical protein
MPHATNEFRFEERIAGWCGKFSKTMTGNSLRAFFVAFDEHGSVINCYFAEGRSLEYGREQFLQSCSKGWLSWSPFDAPEYYSVGWSNVSREAMERLIAEPFPEEDFVSERTGEKIEFPAEWSVVF